MLQCEGGPRYKSDQSQPSSLSITAEQFHSDDINIPLSSEQLWKKAEELLVETDSIVSAPGCEKGSKMVKNRSGK